MAPPFAAHKAAAKTVATAAALKRTPLHAAALEAGARMVPIAGWELAEQFAGLEAEHQAVRTGCGVFDLSHMGVVRIGGNGAKDALQTLVPTDLFRIGGGEACYTVLLNDAGGIQDDLIVYDRGLIEGREELLLVINAACTEADTAWLGSQLEPAGFSLSDHKGDGVLLALQGPQAAAQLEALAKQSLAGLPRFGHRTLTLAGVGEGAAAAAPAWVARTGSTGEDGFELLLERAAGIALWQLLLTKGVVPCGLGARDTLRLEAGLPLHGPELSSQTTPLEAGLGWLVQLEMPKSFVGRTALEEQSAAGAARQLVGLKLPGRAIARQGYAVLANGQRIGWVTSGSWSPSLGEAIALAYVTSPAAQLGTELAVEIDGKAEPAMVVKRPFYRR